MLKIAFAGARGRMGRALQAAIVAQPDLRIVGATERGAAIGQRLSADPASPLLSASAAEAAADADIWIDFTTPDATLAGLAALNDSSVRAAIIGTTGLTAAQEQEVTRAGARLALVRSGNFSLGVNLLAALVKQAARALGPDWDIEILESHHRRKVDAPSGTALMLGAAAAEGRGRTLKDLHLAPRDGVAEPRPEGGIGFAVRRAGGIVGEHEVMFASEREVLRLSHDALDRSLFADGAIAAARWAAAQKPGLYAMSDVLGL